MHTGKRLVFRKAKERAAAGGVGGKHDTMVTRQQRRERYPSVPADAPQWCMRAAVNAARNAELLSKKQIGRVAGRQAS